jgi:hypothetical protein
MVSLISVSRSSKLALRARLLDLLGGSTIPLLRRGSGSAWNVVERGEKVSRFDTDLRGLRTVLGTRLPDKSTDKGLWARRDFLVDAVAGGRL